MKATIKIGNKTLSIDFGTQELITMLIATGYLIKHITSMNRINF